MSIATSRKGFESGYEILDVKLFGHAIRAFQERLTQGDHLIYLSCAGLHAGDILKVELVSADERIYGDECLHLEVYAKNPGGHVADFIRDHWSHKLVVPLPFEDVFTLACHTCAAVLNIKKEAFDD